jgi:glycosyltransferase involved in cell wall biosynthesis
MPGKLRVVHMMAGAKVGGAEAFFMRLVGALAERGLTQHVITRDYPDLMAFFDDKGVPVTKAAFRGVLDLKTRLRIRETLASVKPHLVMTWMSRATQFCPKGDYTVAARLGGYYDLKYYQKADYLIGNTQDLQDYFQAQGWSSDYTAYLPNFVSPPNQSPAADRRYFDTPKDVPLFLTFGRLHAHKAFDVLIRAMTMVPDAYLWIGGEGPEEAALRTLVAELGLTQRVRFLGWQKETSPFYKACDVYVCPSRIEPLGNVILEAWIHEKPVVAAKSAGPLGLITPGQNGLLVPLEDHAALARALTEMLTLPEQTKTMARSGRQTYDARFSEDAVVAQYLSFFERVKGTKRGEVR